MSGHLFTEHDLFIGFLLGVGIGLLAGGFAIAAIWSRAVDAATALPAPDAPAHLAGDATERIAPLPVHDLRRPRTTFQEMA